MLLAGESYIAIARQFLLGLAHQCIQSGLYVRQAVANVRHEGLIETLGKKLCSASIRHVPVCRVVSEKVALRGQGIVQRLAALDVLLRAVDNANKAKLERVDPSREDVHGIRAVVHQIQFRQDPNRPLAHGIDMAGELQRLRVHEVDVGGRDSEDDAVRLRNVLGDEVARLLLDVCRLVANGDLWSLAAWARATQSLRHPPWSGPAGRRA